VIDTSLSGLFHGVGTSPFQPVTSLRRFLTTGSGFVFQARSLGVVFLIRYSSPKSPLSFPWLPFELELLAGCLKRRFQLWARVWRCFGYRLLQAIVFHLSLYQIARHVLCTAHGDACLTGLLQLVRSHLPRIRDPDPLKAKKRPRCSFLSPRDELHDLLCTLYRGWEEFHRGPLKSKMSYYESLSLIRAPSTFSLFPPLSVCTIQRRPLRAKEMPLTGSVFS